MKTKMQWKSTLLWLPLIFGLVVSGAPVSEVISSETGEADTSQEEKPEFRVKQVTSELVNDVYLLNALIEYDLSNAVLEALVSGVPITIELQMEVVVPRQWVWDKNIAKLSQQYRIEYYALTDQYLVTNLNSQSQNIYASQQQALDALGVITELPLIDSHLLKGDKPYYGKLRARLMIEELPAPLRVLAYLSFEWHLVSEWTTWRLQ